MNNSVSYYVVPTQYGDVHIWISDEVIAKLYGYFPHHNPKIGSHPTVEELTREDYEAIRLGTFDRKAFDQKIIEGHKNNPTWAHLWK
jgi:hypothetical protein